MSDTPSRSGSPGPVDPAVRVRRAGERDVPALAALRRTWAERREPGAGPGGSDVGDPGFEQVFTSWWHREAPRRAFWIAETGDEHGAVCVVGSLNVVEVASMPAPGQNPDRWGYVGNLVVPAGMRVRGVPRLLLAAGIAHARERHYTRLVLRPSASGAAFYRAAGFRPAADDMLVLEPEPTNGTSARVDP